MATSTEIELTFVVTAYNLARYLPACLNSALAQTQSGVEVILVDDGSTDETPEVAARYGDRVRYIRKSNAGLSAARNTGILAARGRWLHFLDADDCVDPEFAEVVVQEAERDPGIGIFVVRYRAIDENGDLLWNDADYPLGEDQFHQLLGHNYGPPVVFAVRRDCLANVGLFDVSLTSCEDWDFWLRLAAKGYRFHRIERRVASYRQLAGSMSKNGERMWRMTKRTVRSAISFANHGNCAQCRARRRLAILRCAASFVTESVWGTRESRTSGEWRRRMARLYPMLARNPSLILPYFHARSLRMLERLGDFAKLRKPGSPKDPPAV